MQTISQQDFTQQPLKAWQSSQSEPIFITDKDENSRVLLSYARYNQLLKEISKLKTPTNSERLRMSKEDLAKIDDDFEFQRIK